MFGHFKERHSGEEFGDCRHRQRHGGFGGWEGFGRGMGRAGRERFFDGGDLRLVILKLIAEKPSYGYEIIKAIEERLSGGYTPSPGVVYPTLTLLEEEGLATVTSTDGAKKLYAATEQGRQYLEQNGGTLRAIFERMEHAERAFGRERNPQVSRAMMNLMMAFRMRMKRGELKPEQVKKIAEAIDAAARAIDEA